MSENLILREQLARQLCTDRDTSARRNACSAVRRSARPQTPACQPERAPSTRNLITRLLHPRAQRSEQ